LVLESIYKDFARYGINILTHRLLVVCQLIYYVSRTKQILRDDIESWDKAFRELCRKGVEMNKLNPDIVVPSENLQDPRNTDLFRRSEIMSLNKGTEYVFRDKRREDSLQVRVYKDGKVGIESTEYEEPVYHVQLDQFNPVEGPVAAIGHLFSDIIGVEVPGLEN
jgi:hypothetical protein